MNKTSMVRELDKLIRQAVPESKVVPKYGGNLYTLKPDEKEGQFCGVFIYKAHVQLAFSEGTSLNDPSRLLEGTGKYRRHINFRQSKDMDENAVAELIRQAAKLSTVVA